MRAGEAIDLALKAAARATGPLTYAWVKERASRAVLEQAAQDLEEAAAIIRSALPAPPPEDYSATSPGEENQE